MPDQLCRAHARALAADPAASDDNCLVMRGLLLTGGAPHALVVSDSAYLGAVLPAALVRSVALYAPPQASAAAGLRSGDQAAQPATAALPQLRGSAGHGLDGGAAASGGPAPALGTNQAATGRPTPAQPQLRGAGRVPAAGPHLGRAPAPAQMAAAPSVAQQGAGSDVDAPASASAPSAGSFDQAGPDSGAHAGAASAAPEAPSPTYGGAGLALAPQAGPGHVSTRRDGSHEDSGSFAAGPTSSHGSVKGLTVQAAALPAGDDGQRDAQDAAAGPAPAPVAGVPSAGYPGSGALAAAPGQAHARPEALSTFSARPGLGAYVAEDAARSAGHQNPRGSLNPGGSRAAAAVRSGVAAGPTSGFAGTGRYPGAGEGLGAPAPGAGVEDGPAAGLNVGSYPGLEQGAP